MSQPDYQPAWPESEQQLITRDDVKYFTDVACLYYLAEQLETICEATGAPLSDPDFLLVDWPVPSGVRWPADEAAVMLADWRRERDAS